MAWIFGSITKQLKELLAGQVANTERLRLIQLVQNNDGERLRRIEVLLTPPTLPDAPPQIVEWRAISERELLGDDGIMKLITYKADLPAVTTGGTPNFDVDRQKVTVTVDGEEKDSQVLPVLATEVTFEVQSLKTVQLKRSLIDTDDLEGPQVASETFVAKGNIPPTAPGDFGAITAIGEREVPDA